jgi:hypothetical protein
MAFMTDVVFDEKSGRHEMLFVNQQYDYLMYIAWDEERQDYLFNGGHLSDAEAIDIARRSGRDNFDPAAALAEARVELPRRDRERAAKR